MKQGIQSLLVICSAILCGASLSVSAQTTTFSYTGSVQVYSVPLGVTQIVFVAEGGSGGQSAWNYTSTIGYSVGGHADHMTGTLNVTPGEVLDIYVGGQGNNGVGTTAGTGGFNGGANGVYVYSGGDFAGAGGGGATDIRTTPYGLADRIVVAGAGGGGGSDALPINSMIGGDGGVTGGTGLWSSSTIAGHGGFGGTSGGPGLGGTYLGWGAAAAGTLGAGGIAGSPSGGGGGGGGLYGGGGGSWGGGGGGSSYNDLIATTGVVHTTGASTSSDGYVSLTITDFIPFFVGGVSQGFILCENSAPFDFSSMMTINDLDFGQTETWSVLFGPTHGVLTGFPATGTSTGGTLTTSGDTYQPNTGFSGIDSFKIQIADGVGGFGFTTVIVTVNPLPSAGTITGSATVCVGGTTTLTDLATGGTWNATNANATVAGGLVSGITAGVDTIIYTVINTCGTAADSFVITASPGTSSPGIITGPTTVCVGSVIILADTAIGGVWGATNASATAASGGIVSGVSVGVDTILYTLTLSCGTLSSTYPVTVNTVPSPGTIIGPATVCLGTTITLTDAAPGGFWSASNASATVLGGVVTGMYPSIDTIVYTVFNSCGAISATYPVTILPLPFAGFITGLSGVCVGASITLSDPAPGGFWTATNADATAPGGIVTGVSAGIDTIVYTVTTVCGVATASFPVNVIPLPFAGAITGPSVVCEESLITLTDAAVGGVWSRSNVHATVASGVVMGVAWGVDTIIYSVTTICGTAATSYPVTVNPLPHPGAITGATSVCVGASISLSDTSVTGTWGASNGRATVSAGAVTGVAIGADTIMYTVVNSCGTADSTYTVTVKDVPVVAAITGPTPTEVCVGSTISLADGTAGGSWSASNGSASVSGGVVSGVAKGIVNISYTVTNVCGPTSSLKEVNVITTPAPNGITGFDTICHDQLDTLRDSVSGGVWSITNNHSYIDVTGVVGGNTEGLDTVIYTCTNQCGTAQVTFDVYVRADAVCDGVGVHPLSANETIFKVYPNPNQGAFTLLLSSGIDEPVMVTITNVVGEKVNSFITATNRSTDVTLNMPPGIYVVNASTTHGRYVTKVTIE